jgi:hypothetical protein
VTHPEPHREVGAAGGQQETQQSQHVHTQEQEQQQQATNWEDKQQQQQDLSRRTSAKPTGPRAGATAGRQSKQQE